jgi:hypothetical protein
LMLCTPVSKWCVSFVLVPILTADEPFFVNMFQTCWLSQQRIRQMFVFLSKKKFP